MRLTKKISAIVLALALLISCMGVFTVSAATDTALDITGFYNGTAYAQYVMPICDQVKYSDSSWRMFFHTTATLSDIYASFGDYTVTWDNGSETGTSAVQMEPQVANSGIIHAVIWGVPDAATLVDGATMKIAAGTGTYASNGNTITLQNDVNLRWDSDAQTWEYIATPAYTGASLSVSSSGGGTNYIYLSGSDSIPYSGSWSYRYHDVGTQGAVTLVHDGVETEMEDAYFQKIDGSHYYLSFNGVTAQEGDVVRIGGVFGNWDYNYEGKAGWFPYTFVEIPEAVFEFDGTTWTVVDHVTDENTVVVPYLDVVSSNQSATAFYTNFPAGYGGFTMDAWNVRFYPMTIQDGGFVDGTAYANRFELDGSNTTGGLPVQTALGEGLYITGFGTATAGTTVTLKGNFYSKNRDTGVETGESLSFYAPVTFTYDGTTWTRTSEIPDMPEEEIVYDDNYTGSFTVAGANTTSKTTTAIYLKGSESLADAFVGDYSDGTWNMAMLTAASGDDNGVFLTNASTGTTTKITTKFQQYSQSNRYYYMDGFSASNVGDILTIKGDFVNVTYSVKITVEEAKFQWNGSQWVDYIEYNYNDFTVTGLNQLLTTEESGALKYRHFYLNIDGTVPGDWDKFTGLQAAVNGGTKFDVNVGNNGSTSVICFDVHKDYMAESIDVGTTITLYAGEATPHSSAKNLAADDAIRLLEDYTLEWNGTEWVEPDTTVYEDLTITGFISPTGQNANSSRWDFYLTVDGTIPGTADSAGFRYIKATVVDADGNTILEKDLQFDHAAHGPSFFTHFKYDTLAVDALTAGSKVTFHAGKAAPTKDSNGINILNDFTIVWDGSAFVLEEDYNPITYYDFTVTGLNQVVDNISVNGHRAFYLNISGTVPGDWDKFTGLQASVNGGEKFNVRVGNNGSTSVICFDVSTNYLAETVDVGTKLTLHAGEATPESATPANVNTTDVIRLGADYTVIWNGTAWVAEADYVVYNDITITGTVSPTGWNTNNSRWDFYMTVDGTIPGVGDSGYGFTPGYVTVVDGNGNTLVNKVEKIIEFAAHQTTLFFTLSADVLPQASVTEGTTLTVYGGKMDPYKYNSVATNEDGYKLGINVLSDFTLVWDGTSWVPYFDRSDYTVVNGSLTLKGADAAPTATTMYLRGSDTLATVFNDLIQADIDAGNSTGGWNSAFVYAMIGADNGVFVNGTKVATKFQKYSTSNGWYMDNFSVAAGDTLVIKGEFYNDIAKTIVVFAPLTLTYDGEAWTQQITTDVDKDVNGDGVVDIRDAVLLKRHLVDTSVAVSNKSDINESGSTTADDQRVLRRYLLGIIVTYVNDIPVGTPYYAGGEMIKVAFSAPPIGSIDWDTGVVTFKSDTEIDRLMDDYAAAGFTHINSEVVGYYYDLDATHAAQTLLYRYFEEAEERGMQVIVASQYLNRLLQTEEDIDTLYPNWQNVMSHIVSVLDDYSSFWGLWMADEPNTGESANYVKVINYMKANHPTVGMYWANFPNYVGADDLGAYSYEEYVKVLGTAAGYFMYDNYCLTNKESWLGSSSNYIEPYWFSNLNTVASVARDNGNFLTGITMQTTALTPQGGGLFQSTTQRRQITSDADMGFQVYTALAYGMKELSYFTYADHAAGESAGVVLNTSMVGTDLTTKNAAYTGVKNTHAEIKDLEAALLNYNWLGTIELNIEQSSDQTSTYTAADNSRLASISNQSGAMVIGCMKDVDGYDGYMVANASEPSKSSTSTVTLTFNNATKALVYIDGVAQEVTLSNGSYTVSVADGEGVFIIPILEG